MGFRLKHLHGVDQILWHEIPRGGCFVCLLHVMDGGDVAVVCRRQTHSFTTNNYLCLLLFLFGGEWVVSWIADDVVAAYVVECWRWYMPLWTDAVVHRADTWLCELGHELSIDLAHHHQSFILGDATSCNLLHLYPLALPAVPPLPIPVPPLVLPPLELPDLPTPLATLPLVPPLLGRPDCLALGGAEYLLEALELVGGFSTKDVSVVMNVASASPPPCERSRKGEFWSCVEVSLWRVKDCGIGAYRYR